MFFWGVYWYSSPPWPNLSKSITEKAKAEHHSKMHNKNACQLKIKVKLHWKMHSKNYT